MFPLRAGDELFFNGSSNPQQQYQIPQDLILGHASVDGSNIADNMGKSRGRKTGDMDTEKIPGDNHKNNKKMHREIERQRRQEMTTLYASLRSLLPLEFIKGKRSISDQMDEAVNYIRHLEKKIKELGVHRDEIKRLSSLRTPAAVSQIGSSDHKISQSPCSIIVRPSMVGVEIVYSCGYLESGLPLSRLLDKLIDEGLCVVNCVSTRVNERILHAIQTEVNDPTNFNLSELQQKLTQVK